MYDCVGTLSCVACGVWRVVAYCAVWFVWQIPQQADDKSLAEAYGVTFAKQRRRDAFEVTLTKQETDKSFGVKFGGPANYEEAEQLGKGLFISAVMPNTPADRDALLVKNLQILAVNGVDMTACGSLKLDAMPTLKTLTSSMTLKLKPNASLAKTYNNHRTANIRASKKLAEEEAAKKLAEEEAEQQRQVS